MKKGSLRGRVVFIFLAVVLLVIGVYCVMNSLFWKKVYMRKNQGLLKASYEELKTRFSDPETTSEELWSYAVEQRAKDNISFVIQGNGDWNFMVFTEDTVSPYEKEFLLERLQDNMLNPLSEGIKVLEKGDSYTLQYVELPSDGTRFLECYGYLTDADGNEKMFFLSMPLEKMFQASVVSNSFFIYVSLVLAVIGAVAISYATYRLTKPILELSNLSKRMSNLDFSARYQGNGNDEIAELGNNMNEMASQLQRTILRLQMANEELKRDLEEKEHVDEMRKDFISNVSHELKTPIALIQGYAEGLKEFGAEDPESRDYYIEVITDEAEKMDRLVKKLTTLNKIEFGTDEPEMTSFDIMEVLSDLVKGTEKLQAETGARVTLNGPASCMVSGDEYKIEEVLNNYCSNAFNHLEEPKEITFFFDDVGPKIRISVKNTGKNIPEEELQNIWIKFYKVDKARTRAYGGSGLGLSIVKAIMNAHHEECGVYNVEDGVVFWFELPKAPEEASGDGTSEEDPGTGEADVVNGEIIGEVR